MRSSVEMYGNFASLFEFKVRFRNHKSSMKTNKKTCEVAIHFNRTPHVLSDLTFQCIDQIQTSMSEKTETLLITKEAYWSAQLFSLSPEFSTLFYLKIIAPHQGEIVLEALRCSLHTTLSKRKNGNNGKASAVKEKG